MSIRRRGTKYQASKMIKGRRYYGTFPTCEPISPATFDEEARAYLNGRARFGNTEAM